MKIVRLEAENIKKLKAVQITPQGNLVQISGANAAGKSSVLDAIFYALAGSKGIPSEPVRKGSSKAHIKLDLGELVVTRKFGPGGTTSLLVEQPGGLLVRSPQKLLDDLLGELAFDPLAFTRMAPKDQLEQLRRLVKLEVDVDALDAANAGDYQRRQDLNRQAKQLEGAAAQMLIPANLPKDEVDVSKLLNELEQIGQANAAAERAASEARGLNVAANLADENAGRARARAERLRREAEEAANEATALEAEAKANREKAAAIEVPAPRDTAPVRARIDQAKGINEGIAQRQRQRDTLAQRDQLEAQAKELSDKMDARNQQKQAAVAGAKMPVPGLAFGAGEVLFNGLPLAQASQAEQLRVSLAIAMAANPKLRILRIADGSLLDQNSLALIADQLKELDFQCWMEVVDTSGKVGVYLEDGSVAAENAPPAAAQA